MTITKEKKIRLLAGAGFFYAWLVVLIDRYTEKEDPIVLAEVKPGRKGERMEHV